MPIPYGRVPSTPFPPQYQQGPMPARVGQPVPGNWNAASVVQGQAPRMPVNAAMASGTPSAAAVPRPTIRLQAPDTLLTKPAAPVALPSPEALGIRMSAAPAPAAAILDWNLAHARMQRLGALGIHVDRLPQGIRVTLILPAGQQLTHHVEVVAQSEAVAVNTALDNAESWTIGRK